MKIKRSFITNSSTSSYIFADFKATDEEKFIYLPIPIFLKVKLTKDKQIDYTDLDDEIMFSSVVKKVKEIMKNKENEVYDIDSEYFEKILVLDKDYIEKSENIYEIENEQIFEIFLGEDRENKIKFLKNYYNKVFEDLIDQNNINYIGRYGNG